MSRDMNTLGTKKVRRKTAGPDIKINICQITLQHR
jgi:hypothetical protein